MFLLFTGRSLRAIGILIVFAVFPIIFGISTAGGLHTVQNRSQQFTLNSFQLMQRMLDQGSRCHAASNNQNGSVAHGSDQQPVGYAVQWRGIDNHISIILSQMIQHLFHSRIFQQSRRILEKVGARYDISIFNICFINHILVFCQTGQIIIQAL